MLLTDIDSGIRGLRTSVANMRKNSQALIIGIMRVAADNGDCSRALHLVRALPAKLQPQAVAYFKAFSPITVTMSKDVKKQRVGLAKPDMKTYVPFNIDGANATHWMDYGKEPAPKKSHNLTSFREDFQALIKRYEVFIEKSQCGDPDEVRADIQTLRNIAADMGARFPTPRIDAEAPVEGLRPALQAVNF